MNLLTNNNEYYGIIDRKISIFKQNVAIEICGGNLIQVVQVTGEQITIKIFSLQGGTLLWSTDLFTTAKSNIIPVSIKLWEILLAVKFPDMRTRIMKNGKGFTNFLLGIQIGSKVTIRGSVLNRNNDLPCIVKYIGYVPEIGPGTFYGFELRDVNDKLIPRNNLVFRYCKCDNSKGFIRSADCFLNQANDSVKNKGTSGRDTNRKCQTPTETPNVMGNKAQPSTSTMIAPLVNKRKPNALKPNESSKNKVEPQDSEIEELRKKIEVLELQLKEKALKDKLNSDEVSVLSEAKVYHRRKPKRNNKQYGRNKNPDEHVIKDVTAGNAMDAGPSGAHLRNPKSETLLLSQSDLSYFEQIRTAAPPLLKPINIFDNKERQQVSHDSTGYRELIDFLN